MKPPAPPSRSLRELRDLTPARVGLGRAGASMPTKALLDFTLAHARARDAVHAGFDVPAIISGLSDLGLEALDVSSRARNRQDYLRRPDLGRTLDPASQHLLASRSGGACQLAIVIGDGLSPTAVNAHAVRTSCAASFRDWPRTGSKSAMPWLQRARGSHWATRSAPFSARA